MKTRARLILGHRQSTPLRAATPMRRVGILLTAATVLGMNWSARTAWGAIAGTATVSGVTGTVTKNWFTDLSWSSAPSVPGTTASGGDAGTVTWTGSATVGQGNMNFGQDVTFGTLQIDMGMSYDYIVGGTETGSGARTITWNSGAAGTPATLTFNWVSRTPLRNWVVSNMVLNSDLNAAFWARGNRESRLSGVISGPGSLNLRFTNADATTGSFVLWGTAGGAANTYSGGTSISYTRNGSAGFAADMDFRAAKTGAFGTGYLDLNRATVNLNSFSQTVGGLTGGANGSVIKDNATTAGTTVLTLDFPGNRGPYTFSGAITNGATRSLALTKQGTGTQILTGASTYTGITTVNAGLLVVDSTSNATVLGNSPLVLGGGTFQYRGGTAGSAYQRLNGLTINIGHSAVEINNQTAASTLDLRGGTFLGITRNDFGTVDFRSADGTPPDASAAVIQSYQANGAGGILGAWATVGSGRGWASKDASDRIVDFSGYTDINAQGNPLADAPATNVRINAAGTGGYITLASPTTTINTLLEKTPTAATIDTALGLLRLGPSGGILVAPGSGDLSIGTPAGTGTLTAGGTDNGAGEVILQNHSTSTLTVNCAIADNGTGVVSLTKSGPGLAVLAAANTFGGLTTVAAGTLHVDHAYALQNSTLNLVGGTGASVFNARNPVLGGLQGFGPLDMTAQTFTIGHNNADTTYSGVLSNGSFTKTGTGTFTYIGCAAYNGTTTIQQGKLLLSGTGAINSSSDVVVGTASSPGSLITTSSVAITAPITMTNGIIGGTGAISAVGGVTLGDHAIISPANVAGTSPGVQAYTTGLTFASGGTYQWEMNRAVGVAGTNWDLLTVTDFHLAIANDPFTIRILGLDLTNTPGVVSLFMFFRPGSWLALSADAPIANFDESQFICDWTNFASYNPMAGGSFALVRGDNPVITGGSSNQLWVTFTPAPVPEPSSLLLLGLGGLSVLTRNRRRGIS